MSRSHPTAGEINQAKAINTLVPATQMQMYFLIDLLEISLYRVATFITARALHDLAMKHAAKIHGSHGTTLTNGLP